MDKINCPKGVWTEVATNVTDFSFNLINGFPDDSNIKAYKIHWGSSEPAVDTDVFNIYRLDCKYQEPAYSLPVQFSNTSALNIYVMCVYDDGVVTY